MSLGKIRGVLYKAGRLLGDFNALGRNKAVPRIERRILGRVSKRFINKVK